MVKNELAISLRFSPFTRTFFEHRTQLLNHLSYPQRTQITDSPASFDFDGQDLKPLKLSTEQPLHSH
jgi:hypothetical protein